MVEAKQTLRILEQIENKSSYETKKFLAVEFNHPIQTHEVLKPQQDDSVRLELTLSQEQLKTLERAKDLLSHVLPAANWVDVIAYLAEKHLQKSLGKSHFWPSPYSRQKSRRKSSKGNCSIP